MSASFLLLAPLSLLSLAQPATGTAPAAPPAAAAQAAPVAAAPAPAPATAAPEPPPPRVIVTDKVEVHANTATVVTPTTVLDREPPPIPPPQRPHARRGVGLMITSGVFGAIAWGATVGQMKFVDGCRADIRSGQLKNTAYNCAMHQQDHRIGVATGYKVVANLATWGVAPAAGAVRGNYNAIDTVWGTKRRHRPAFWIGTGVVLTVAGVVGSASSLYYLGQPCRNGDCTNELRSYFFAQQLSQSAFSAGLGILSYGIAYHHSYRRQEENKQRRLSASLSVSPQLQPGGGGAALTARF